MKVLLLTDVRGVGRKGEIKEVAEGYGRNFLVARKLATVATGGTLNAHQASETQKKENEVLRIERAKEAAAKINGKEITFYLRTDKKGSVFGSVKNEEILRAIKDDFGSTPDVVLEPKAPLKTKGDHIVVVSWKPDIKATLTARVLPQS